MEPLVPTEWLAREMGAADLRIVDANYFPLDPSRDPAADHRAGHIPGARYLDLATLADPASDLPSMLPPDDLFAARLARLGIGQGDRVVLYDDSPHHTAARAWWMFRLFGLRAVAILDGGIARWRAEGRPIAQWEGDAAARAGPIPVTRDEGMLRDMDRMRANLAGGGEQVVDARGAARFTGEEADPRGLASGHIPHSRNLPYNRLFAADGRWKDVAAIRAEFGGAGIDLARPIVATCGSGITAAVLLFAAYLTGKEDIALYDGSWSEWGLHDDTPKAIGPA